MSATRMVFRTVKGGRPFEGTIDAVILDATANPRYVVCYSHIGQHSEGCLSYYRTNTRPATRAERLRLVREMQQLYGVIRIVSLPPRGWRGCD